MVDFRLPFFSAIWMVAFGLNAQTATLNIIAEKDSVGLGEPVTLVLTSDEPLTGGQRWAWPEHEPGDTLAQGWEILSVGTVDSMASPDLDAGLRRSQRLVIMAWDTGMKVIAPFQLTAENKPAVLSSPKLLQVGLAPIESNPAPMPLQGYLPFAWTWWERFLSVLPWILGTMATLGVLAWGLQKWKQRNTDQPEAEPAPLPSEPAHVLALRMLHGLRTTQPWTNGDGKEAQAQLSEAVRLHLQGTFGVKALERATEELTAQLNESATRGIDPDDVLWLTQLLRQSDLVKFAKQSMGHDAHLNAVNGAIRWVERTQPKPQEDVEPGERSGSKSNTENG